MSKSQIDTFKTGSYRQLTAQDVSERLRLLERALDPTVAQAVRVADQSVRPCKNFDLADVPEHLF